MEGTHDQYRHRLGRAHRGRSFNGSFANTPAHELGASTIKAALDRAGVSPDEVSETILGQVLTAGQGQNPARQAHIAAGLPVAAAAWGINQVCGSGLRAVALAAQHIALGDATSWWPAARRACRSRRTARICAPGRRWAT